MNLSSDFEDDTILPTVNSFSDLAKIRFIADSLDVGFRGSNKQECIDIECIRNEYREYLYSSNPPKELVAKLLPIADRLLSALDRKSLWLVGFYEPL